MLEGDTSRPSHTLPLLSEIVSARDSEVASSLFILPGTMAKPIFKNKRLKYPWFTIETEKKRKG
jgi:hypothetical protein